MRRHLAAVAAATILILGATPFGPGAVPDAGAAGDSGAAPVPTEAAPGLGGFPPVVPGTYAPPLEAPVSDPFRAPAHRYGPGNRGIEYRTRPGTPVRAIGAGRVVFAGQVGGRLAVTVLHPDGRRSSYTWLATIRVRRDDLVARGAVIGTASTMLHLGVREGDRYIDPATLFASARRRAVLVPTPRAGG